MPDSSQPRRGHAVTGRVVATSRSTGGAPRSVGPSGPRTRQSPPRRTRPLDSPGPVGVAQELGWGWLGPTPRSLFSAGWVLLPLRAFLGFTFCFAGLQKLANPGFFDATNPASIQAQLTAAAHRSPIHALLSPLTHVAVPVGVLIALGELAVGLGTLLGLWTRIAAVGGALISFMLFLTVSYHSHPYYTGSDIVFLFAWLPVILAGSGGVLAADAVLANRARRAIGAEPEAVVPLPFAAVRRVCGFYEGGRCTARQGEPCAPAPCPYLAQRPDAARRLQEEEINRRTFVLRGTAAGAAAVLGGLGAGAAAGAGRAAGGRSNGSATPSLGTGGQSTASAPPNSSGAGGATSTTSAPSTTSPPATTHPPGTRIGPARDVPVGGAASFQDPHSGDPSLVVQPTAGNFVAFDAVCPHAGCTVQYDNSGKLFICPCHGSEFNGKTGAVEVGPATSGLAHIGIAEGSDGQLYVT